MGFYHVTHIGCWHSSDSPKVRYIEFSGMVRALECDIEPSSMALNPQA